MAISSLSDLPSPPVDQSGWPWTEEPTPATDSMQDGSPWPTISVVTPSYNQGAFIEETIRSVILQGYPNLEYIVIDGGSTDETVDIIKRYDSWIDHWVSGPDDGQSDAINKGFAKATGHIFAWLNSDDYYAPEALQTMAHAFSSCSDEVGALVGTGHKIDQNGDIVYTPEVPELTHQAFLDWMNYGHFMQPACFFRRGAWEESGPLRTDLRYPMDVDLWLKMSKKYRFERVDSTIAYAYRHAGAKTTGERPGMQAETIVLIAEHGGFDIAYRDARSLADDLAATRDRLNSIRRHPFVKWPLRLYNWFRWQ